MFKKNILDSANNVSILSNRITDVLKLLPFSFEAKLGLTKNNLIYYYRHKYKDGLGETCCICVTMHMGGKGETERKETETIRDTEREIPSVTDFHQ